MRKQIKNQIMVLLLLCTLFMVYPFPVAAASELPKVNAKSYIMMDFESGVILDKKMAEEPRPPASMTKMMSEFIVLDQIKSGKIQWEDEVTVSKRAAAINEAQINLIPGEKETVRELFIAMAVQSANDATVALAEHVGGSEEAFVELMNQKAQELGMKNTHYRNATGLDMKLYPIPPKVDGKHEMSAHDSAILATQLMKTYPEVIEFTSMSKYTFREGTKRAQKVTNWNWMLPGLKMFYDGVDGVKTGHTDAAGYCFTGTAKKGDYRLVTVVMGTSSEARRFTETKKLLDYGFNEFQFETLLAQQQPVPGAASLPLPNGVERTVPVVIEKEIKFPMHTGEKSKYQIQVKFQPGLKAPLAAGTVVGSAKVLYDGKEIEGLPEYNVVTQVAIEEGSWFRLFFREVGDTIKGWFE